MNEESRPARRLPDLHAARDRSGTGGWPAWRREVNRLPDEELIRVVRAMASVDKAVAGFREAAP
jgi:hypothetical protein